MRDLGKAFSFFFQDPSWIAKSAIAAGMMILSLFGIGIPVLAGYFIQLTQRVMRREEYPLPAWSDVGVQFVTGFKYCVVFLIYVLPVILLYIPFIALIVAGAVAGESDGLNLITTLYLFPFMAFVLVYSVALAAASPIIAYRFAERERISDALDIAVIYREFKENWQNALVVALLTIAVQSFAMIGIVFLLIGVFLTIFYAYAVSAYLAGLLYCERHSQEVAA